MSRVSGAHVRIRGASRVQCAVICKVRNNVFRACARKPVQEATLRARCGVTRRSGGTTTSRSLCLAAHPAESASRPCGFMRWVLVIRRSLFSYLVDSRSETAVCQSCRYFPARLRCGRIGQNLAAVRITHDRIASIERCHRADRLQSPFDEIEPVCHSFY